MDSRITYRTGAPRLFGDTTRCDDCPKPAVLLTETITELPRGAEREGGQYCLGHGLPAIDLLTATPVDAIEVTIHPTLAVDISTALAA